MTIKTNTSSRLAALILLTGLASAPLALAQDFSDSDFERPFGFAFGEENRAFDPSSRDINGNRLIVDGRIITGDDLSSFSASTLSRGGQSLAGAGFLGQGSSQNTAVGNQLNVITQGSFNTVIIDSTQINNGNQTAIIGGQQNPQREILNGELNLND
jgi:holdfast attachment protein HfaA